MALRKYINEVIGAEERCTNVALKSLGICIDKPVMNSSNLIVILRKKYNVYQYIPHAKDSYENMKRAGDYAPKYGDYNKMFIAPVNKGEYYEQLGWGFPQSTVNRFVKLINDQDTKGHFFLMTRKHILVVHNTDRHGIVIVDAEEKFNRKQKIEGLVIVEQTQESVENLNNFLESTEKTSKLKYIQ